MRPGSRSSLPRRARPSPILLRIGLGLAITATAISLLTCGLADQAPVARPEAEAQLPAKIVDPGFGPEDFLVVAGPAQPELAIAAVRTDGALRLAIETVEIAAGSEMVPAVGVGATKAVRLGIDTAKAERNAGRVRFSWLVAAADLGVAGEADWARLRAGVALRWTGGPPGTDRRRERYLHLDGGAPAQDLSPRLQDWRPLDLGDLAQRAADRRARLAVACVQPMDGEYSVVIEDGTGRRVRNLASGQRAAKGPLNVEWDGCDEDGQLVTEGTYRWRSLHHAGIAAEHAMGFCNADEPGYVPLLSNHCHFIAAAAGQERVVLAAVGTEGGFAMAAFDREGRWQQGFNPILGAGWDAVAVAVDGKHLYAAHDGQGWGMQIDKNKPGWTAEVGLTLTRFDLAGGQVVDYPGGKRWSELERHAWGPGSTEPALRTEMSLSGMALVGGRLYIGSRKAQAVLVVDPATGKQVASFPVASPGPLAAQGDRLAVLSGGRPLRLDPATGATTPLLPAAVDTEKLRITALALGEDGSTYLADGASHTVLVVAPSGATSVLGRPGGLYAGPWQAERMVAPAGLAVFGNRLWVAEDRTLPKRAVAWDLASRTVVRQIFGNPAYGGSGGGFDPKDPTRWIGEGALWKIDPVKRSAVPTAIVGWRTTGPMHWRWHRQDGRTWLIGLGMSGVIGELRDDGTLRAVAMWASAHGFSYAHDWNPPAAFVEAFNRTYPEMAFTPGSHGKPGHGPGTLWIDRNGDGAMQGEELEFTGKDRLAAAYWGNDQRDLSIRLAASIGGRDARIELKPSGVDARGVPLWPHLAEAMAQAVPLKDAPRGMRNLLGTSTVLPGGDLLVLGEPLACWAPDGGLRWRYPNQWSDVHGSHKAPLPQLGVLQGTLFVLGDAPLDDQGGVLVINGNHGRFFVLTTDGIYVDELFNDCRVAQKRDADLVGGECFGGTFGKGEDGAYWLQTGGEGFRLYRMRGLDRVSRSAGSITVSAAQLMAAERRLARRQADSAVERRAAWPRLQQGKGWPDWNIQWDKSGQFAAKARCAWDASSLHVQWEVRDASPWSNNGKDWTLLFKSGDSVDLQLGTDAGADPRRRAPVPGDLRLLVAPMGAENAVVLYRHRVPGAPTPMAFSSPWRTEQVDVVKRLDTAQVKIEKGADWYRVALTVPLAELGLKPEPGKSHRADFGAIFGDEQGTINLLRSYWSNQATGLVNDVPGEIMLQPELWGNLTVEAP